MNEEVDSEYNEKQSNKSRHSDREATKSQKKEPSPKNLLRQEFDTPIELEPHFAPHGSRNIELNEHESDLDKRAKKLEISIVVPCYNEEEVIQKSYDELSELSKRLVNYEVEIIFVNDGSSDATLDILKSISSKDQSVRVVSFSRNFGHQIAVTAGIDYAQGDAVVLIDADLQDPPEVILEMVAKWEEGYDVVYGVRRTRAGETAFKKKTASTFYRILNTLSDTPIPLDTGDFRLMSRNVVDSLKNMPEADRFVRGMVSWVGYKQTFVEYDRNARFAGESKYPLRKMLAFATDGIISFSIQPLRFATYLGLLVSAVSFLAIVYVLSVRLFTSEWVPGWAGLMVVILFLGGVQLVTLGILGEYVGRIYKQVKARPVYLVEEQYGFAKEEYNK